VNVDGIFCAGRYRVKTVSFEMRMSHWVDAPVVERAEDGATILDLSQDVWDVEGIEEDGDVLVLVMRKYPGLTNGVKVRILPEPDRFALAGEIVSREALISKLKEFE